MRKRDKQAFTLLEMLVIIAIIGVLAVLILATVNYTINSAKQVQNVKNLRQIGLALLTYANDYQGDLPPSKKDDRFGIGMPTPTWGYALTGSPRYLYTANKYGASFVGRQNYLETPDVFYSPFIEQQSLRKRGEFYQENGNTYLGYILYWSPPNGFSGLVNDNIYRASPRAFIYSDFCSDIGETWKFRGRLCSVLYLDGSIKTFDLKEVNKRKFVTDRIKLFMGN